MRLTGIVYQQSRNHWDCIHQGDVGHYRS